MDMQTALLSAGAITRMDFNKNQSLMNTRQAIIANSKSRQRERVLKKRYGTAYRTPSDRAY